MDNITVVDLSTGGELNSQDINILEGSISTSLFNPSRDKVELTVTDYAGELLISDPEYIIYSVEQDPTLQNEQKISTLRIDLDKLLVYYGFDRGTINTRFDFYTPLFFTSPNNQFYISEISTDRAEVRLDSLTLDDPAVIASVQEFIAKIGSSSNIIYFYLNFGSNQLVPAVNLVVDNGSLVAKLYESLPAEFDVKSTFFLTEKVAEPVLYQILLPETAFEDIEPVQQLKGPNLNLNLKNEISATNTYQNYSGLLGTTFTGSFSQLSSILADKGAEINVDYSEFSNFIHYSSAVQRVLNFYQKAALIEGYQAELGNTYYNITGSTSSSLYVSQSRTTIQAKIDNIKKNFDGYDYYLYYESASTAWPKTNSIPPYTLASTSSAAVTTWLGSTNPILIANGGILFTASLYDQENKDNLVNTVPGYLREDPANAPYELFVNMIGQHFDNLWLYTKGVTDKLDSDNRPDYGAPKQLMGDILRSFGLKIYTNQFSGEDLYTGLLGITPSGSLTPSTGSELITSYVTASNYIASNDINVEVYKRLYHNLPYLLKKKGTVEGVRALANIYGIPDTILRISEFGGKDKIEGNDYDFYQQTFNYALSCSNSSYVDTDWALDSWNDDNVPYSVFFRFKFPNTSSLYTFPSQSLWTLDNAGATAGLVVEYTGTGTLSGSYSGSTAASQSYYATVKFTPDNTNFTSVNLPVSDGGWWGFGVTLEDTTFTLHAGNSLYNGYDGSTIGFYTSSNIVADPTNYKTATKSYFPSNNSNTSLLSKTYRRNGGFYQEIHYYASALSSSVFQHYVLNPSSVEGNSVSASYSNTAFRAALGGDLYTGSVSVHPAVTGSGITHNSFPGGNTFTITQGVFVTNEDTIMFNQPIAGIRNIVSDKLKSVNPVYVSGSTLSSYISVEKQTAETTDYTKDINYVEVGFSPQNEINEDIISQLGFFNIGDFIGDPRHQSASTYRSLDQFRDSYFQKYLTNYNFVDYIRILKYLDNSFFKMVKDFVPARSSLASGVVIKQHLLERSKYPVPVVDSTNLDYSGSVKSDMVWNHLTQARETTSSVLETFSGGAAGSVNSLNVSSPIYNVTQSWVERVVTPSGSQNITRTTQEEFYTGEYGGSAITVTTGSLNGDNPFLNIKVPNITYNTALYVSDVTTLDTYLNTNPGTGGCLIYYDYSNLPVPPLGPE